ncbi:MAG TPA: CHAD domain-containing protein [Ktedonobacterales bacterium]|nr:CHAD domain-containing protein [Ktedonobacterales bacterium]
MASNTEAMGEAPLAWAIRRVVRKRVKKARKRLREIVAGADAEAVHDLRGDMRRLRTILAMLEEAPGRQAKRLRRARGELDRLARRLGAVRDLDVLLTDVREYRLVHAEASGLDGFEADLRRRHARARRKLIGALRDARQRRVWRAVRRAVVLCPEKGACAGPVLVRHFAGSAIWRRYEALLAFEAGVADANEGTLHRLRIACKQLNATIEVFEAALGPEAQASRELLTAAQHHLGALHDDVVASQRIERLDGAAATHGARHQAANGALAAYTAMRAADRDRLRAAFMPLWAQLTAPAFRLSLAHMIAAL